MINSGYAITGVSLIDIDHEQLATYMDEAQESAREGKAVAVVDALRQLTKLFEIHCSDELALLVRATTSHVLGELVKLRRDQEQLLVGLEMTIETALGLRQRDLIHRLEYLTDAMWSCFAREEELMQRETRACRPQLVN